MKVPRSSLKLARRFARDRRAMGAVEFVMVAPFLVLLYLGGSQLSMALTVDRKVQHIASTINDLVTQSESLNKADVKGIFNVATAIMIPYDPAPLGISVTQVRIDATGLQKVDWNYPGANMPKLMKGSTFALPADFSGLRDRYVIVAETTYTYKPVAGDFATGPITLGGTSYLNPRIGTKVACTDC